MDGIKGIIGSKKAVFTLLFFIAITLFVLTDRMTMEQWMQASLLCLGGYFTAETVNAVAAPSPGRRDPEAVRVDKIDVPVGGGES